MLPLFLFILFTLPSWTMDDINSSDCVIPISQLEPGSEKTALLRKNNLINEENIPLPPQEDRLTPHLKTLPRELFWSIIAFCEYHEEKDEDVKIITLCKAAVSFSYISKYFKGRVREMIPALTPLKSSSSAISVINFLNQIESCESNHSILATSILCIPNLYTIFPKYYQELNRLYEIEPSVRFSPYFRLYKGASRVKTLCEQHHIQYPKISHWTLPQRLCSSLTKDPYVLIATSLGLTTLTFIGSNSIHTNVLSHKDVVHQANENCTADYAQVLHKNFLYAQSDAYPIQNKVQSCCMDDIYDLIFEPEPCFKKYFSAKACFNSKTVCEPGKMDSYLDQLFTMDNYGRKGPNLTQYLFQQFNGSFSPQSVKNLLAGSLDAMCKNGELSNIYAFHDFREHHINLSTQFMHLNVKSFDGECTDRNMGRTQDYAKLLMGKFDYDPLCIAQHITPPLQMPHIPIPIAIWAWVGTVTGTYGLVTLLLILGWYVFI